MVDRLLHVGSEPIAQSPPAPTGAAELDALLARRNGFYAFDSALHVLPSADIGAELGVSAWNDPTLWRAGYDRVGVEWLCFAEDVFGGQFAVGPQGVASLDPETGDLELLAPDIAGWAEAILDDTDVLTGYPLARDWQETHGPLRPGRRLVPRIPFVLGGTFAVENLYDADTVASLRYRADLAAQLRDLPDGASVDLRVVE